MKITSEMTPAEIMELYPETEAVFEAYFSEESHLDPDYQHEPVDECAIREAVDLESLLDELNQILRDSDEFFGDDDDYE